LTKQWAHLILKNLEYYFDHTGVIFMFRKITYIGFLTGSILLAGNAQATELSAVAYGTISAANQQKKDTSGGKTGGAIIGGLLGLASSSGRSTGTKLLRSGVGAAGGSAVGGAMASGTEMTYTVDLVGGGTVRVVMDSGNFHTGDCVSVERGKTNNMRRVSNEFCIHNKQVPEEYKKEHIQEANECAQAKQELLAATDEAAVNMAHMKMNILCQE
jgi:outer membrane lipoprotein SlyB